MLSLARGTCKRSIRPFTRGFASEASHFPTDATTSTRTPQISDSTLGKNAWRKGKIPVREDHGLWAFFRRKGDAELVGEEAYETVESPRKENSGRAWRASELRLKSFKDLHTLWYVTLRERNLLASQDEEARRIGVLINREAQSIMAGACRRTMSRIKAVMNERRIAYQGAIKLFEEHQEQVQDKQLLKLQRDELLKAQDKLATFALRGRMNQRERRRKLVQARKELELEGVLADQKADGASVDQAASIPAETQAEAKVEVPLFEH